MNPLVRLPYSALLDRDSATTAGPMSSSMPNSVTSDAGGGLPFPSTNDLIKIYGWVESTLTLSPSFSEGFLTRDETNPVFQILLPLLEQRCAVIMDARFGEIKNQLKKELAVLGSKEFLRMNKSYLKLSDDTQITTANLSLYVPKETCKVYLRVDPAVSMNAAQQMITFKVFTLSPLFKICEQTISDLPKLLKSQVLAVQSKIVHSH